MAMVLARRGHRVSVATLPVWREHVERAGLGFHPLAPDIPEDEAAARRIVGRIREAREGSKYLIQHLLGPSVRQSYDDLLAAVRADGGADLLVSHQLPMAGPIVAEVTGIKWVSVVLQPMPFFSAFDPPSLPPAPWVRRVTAVHPSIATAFNRLGRRVTRSWIRPVVALRTELGLPPGGNPLFEGQHSPALVLALFSPIFAAKQPDFPPQTLVTGFPFYDAAEQRAADPDLLRFLDDGDPPLLFTLGSSAVWIAGDFYRTSIDAAVALGKRALLLAGEDATALRARGLPPSVMAVDYAPHGVVMPRSLLSVHSGGIGTTAQALRAGRPMLVVPFAHDQPDNARRCVSLGVARTIPRRAYARARVVHELGRLMSDPSYTARAADVGSRIAAEHGTATACDAIERVIAG
jgi:UDP:flavonoid glycosyltransferase YjiC (YdhE family)